MKPMMKNSQLPGERQAAAERKGAAMRRACIDWADGGPLIFLDGYDEAILGVTEVEGLPRVVYDRNVVVRALMRRDGMDREGATEFFDYNIAGAAVGDGWPLFLHR